MCMIALRPAGSGNIPNAVIDTAMKRHSDGFGIAYRVADAAGMPQLVTEKFGPEHKARKAFRRALKRVDKSGGEYVAHFRWATHGPKAASHSHPYEYNDPDPEIGRVLVFHNGIIDISTKPSESDTEVFVRDVLARLPSRWWASPAMRFLVNSAIDFSKLTIMTAAETFNMHESRGDWDGGLWYSSNHKPSTWTEYRSDSPSTWEPGTRKWVPGYTDTDGTTVYGHYESVAKDDDEGGLVETTGKAQGGLRTITSLIPYKGPAVRSAAALGLLDSAEYNSACDTVRVVDEPLRLYHGGHSLTALKSMSEDVDGDYEDAVICDECETIGSVYVIDGKSYIDMGHLLPEDDEDLLAPYAKGHALGARLARA